MFRKSKIEPVEKVKIVERYLAGNCCKSPGKDYNISRELSCYLKRQSIYQNNLYNTNDTADLRLYGPQWKTKKISFWMCMVPDGA